jgi:MEDS: MEthanogen/methylotroph, DcmR Sensory domain
VMQEVLSLGALGYVVKADAGSELFAAVEAVLHGRQFVSRRLSGDTLTLPADSQVPDRPGHEASPSLSFEKAEITRSHQGHFYSDDASFLVGSAGFIETALKAGSAVVVIATESHQKSLVHELQARGVDCAPAIEEGRLRPLDVAANALDLDGEWCAGPGSSSQTGN